MQPQPFLRTSTTSVGVSTLEPAKRLPLSTAMRERPVAVACLTLCCAAFLYLQTFRLPCIPRLATGDQAIYLFDAARMVDGQVIYRDFDHFTFPGTSGLYYLLFRIFGVKAWIPEAMLILLGTLIALLSFRICRRLLEGPSVLLPGLLFLALPFTGYLDATHHWYSALAAIATLALLIDERTPLRLACAGILWGLATCFAQSMVLGPLALGVFLVWEARRRAGRSLLKQEASLFAAYAGTVVALNSYIVWKVGLRRFFAETVVFVLKYYPDDRFNSWKAYFASRPSIHGLENLLQLPAWFLILGIVPLTYCVFFFLYWKRPRNEDGQPWESLMLVATVGVAMLLTVASAAAYQRLYTVSLPALILLVWFLESHFPRGESFLQTLWALVLLLAVVKPAVAQLKFSEPLDLPTGRTTFATRVSYVKTKWVFQRTQPFDYFFDDQSIGFALRLRNPGRIDFVRPTEYTRPEQVAGLIQGLEAHPATLVSWYPGLDSPTIDPRKDQLGPLREYLRAHYRVAAQFTNGDKIWERSP